MQRICYFPGNLALSGENVHELAIVVTGPKMSVVDCVNQLHGNAHVIVDAPYRSLDDYNGRPVPGLCP